MYGANAVLADTFVLVSPDLLVIGHENGLVGLSHIVESLGHRLGQILLLWILGILFPLLLFGLLDFLLLLLDPSEHLGILGAQRNAREQARLPEDCPP